MCRVKGLNGVVAGLMLWGAGIMGAQELGIDPAAVPPSAELLTVKALEDRLAAVEGDGSLAAEVKAKGKETLGLALEQLKKRDADLAQRDAYQKTVSAVSGEVEALEKQAAAVSLPEDRGTLVTAEERALSPEEFRALLGGEETKVATLQAAKDVAERAVATAKARPAVVQEALPQAQETLRQRLQELSQIAVEESGLEPGADRLLAEARVEAAKALVAKLDQEQLAAGPLLKLRQAELALATARLEREEARLAVLQGIAAERLAAQVAAAKQEAEKAREASGKSGGVLGVRAQEVEELSAELKSVSDRVVATGAATSAMERWLEALRRDRRIVDQQLEIGGGRGAFAQMLLEQAGQLPDAETYRRNLAQRRAEITEVRFAAFQVEGKADRQEALEAEVKTVAGPVQEQVASLLKTRAELLARLQEEYQSLVRKLGKLDLLERETLAEVTEFRGVLDEALFWVPSSPRMDANTFREAPAAAAWLLRPGRWRELGEAVGRVAVRAPFRSGLVLLLVAGTFVVRRRFRREIAAHRVEIRRISSDRYVFTARAVGMLLALVIPWALLCGFLGGEFAADPEGSDWLHGTGAWLGWLAWLVFALLFIREICRKEGVGDVHFGWSEKRRLKMRRAATLAMMVYFPARWVVVTLFYQEGGSHMVDSLGRLVYVGAMLWVAGCLGYLVHPRKGILSGSTSARPGARSRRPHYVWFLLIVGIPLTLAVLAVLGYFFTALQLTIRLGFSLGILGLGYFLYWLVVRWFMMRERRVALEQLRKERQVRREAAAAAAAVAASETGEEKPSAAEEVGFTEAEEDSVDVANVGVQTRKLLRLLVGGMGLVALWFAWADVMPVLRYLDSEPVLGASTIADLLLGGLLAVATVVLARNLPGILEITILRSRNIDPGLRYAVAALVRYAIVAVGLFATFQAIGVDWSKFGWMAAALGVGLGFGLQEIVANFVCGIILLFERPIRVGDVVTVGETTGVISRIRIRATTITDWDRKEFVVPNKEFITGRLLNWTLSNKVNRLVIKVGVAYGSDPERVRSLLSEIATGHSAIMTDPGPLVTFESFGDSCLDFTVRCYLPDLDRRLATTHELHSEIHARFAKEGIEIPFPQRDLNIRSGWGGEEGA